MGWQAVNCFHEVYGSGGTLGRENSGEVVLVSNLLSEEKSQNPVIPSEAVLFIIEEMIHGRSALNLPQANRVIYRLLKDGAKIILQSNKEGRKIGAETKSGDQP